MASYLLSNKGQLLFNHKAWMTLRKYFTAVELFDIQMGLNRDHKDLIMCYNEHCEEFPDCRVIISDAVSAKAVVQNGFEVLS